MDTVQDQLNLTSLDHMLGLRELVEVGQILFACGSPVASTDSCSCRMWPFQRYCHHPHEACLTLDSVSSRPQPRPGHMRAESFAATRTLDVSVGAEITGIQ